MLDAVVRVPGSKSIANRALVCAALAEGRSTLTNVPDGDDTQAMLSCCSSLGLDVAETDAGVAITGGTAHWPQAGPTLDAQLAGTTSRFVTALAALGTEPITIDGLPPLRRRPFGPLHDALVQLGVAVAAESWGQLPVTVTGPPTGWQVSIAGDVSSQYISALMMIGPYLPDGLTIDLTSQLVSRPYVEMTAAIMARFGAEGIAIAEHRITVEKGSYRPTELEIEPDASSASYPLALAAVCGGSIEVTGLGDDSLQGDACFADLLGQMGCTVVRDARSTRVTRSPGAALRGIDVDLADASDLVPTLAAVALFAETPTTITGVGFIRNKESDRLGDLSAELRRAGGVVEETPDGLVIRPSAATLHAARLGTHHDHRLAMAFGVIGARVTGIDVDDPGVVAKSWPRYWQMLAEVLR